MSLQGLFISVIFCSRCELKDSSGKVSSEQTSHSSPHNIQAESCLDEIASSVPFDRSAFPGIRIGGSGRKQKQKLFSILFF